jgi:hypothetical protein
MLWLIKTEHKQECKRAQTANHCCMPSPFSFIPSSDEAESQCSKTNFSNSTWLETLSTVKLDNIPAFD